MVVKDLIKQKCSCKCIYARANKFSSALNTTLVQKCEKTSQNKIAACRHTRAPNLPNIQ